jgi:tetratricopeptide (TPR) repeat protein
MIGQSGLMSNAAKAAGRVVAKGWAAMKSGRPDHALGIFQRANSLSPTFGAWHGTASALQALGDASGAVEAFEQALRMAPGNAETLLALGRLARDLKAPKQAAGFFREAAMSEPGSVPAQIGLAHALRDLDQQEQAAELLQGAIQMQPEAGDLWAALGVVMTDLEDHGNALTFLEEALRLNPRDGAAAGNMAEAAFASGDTDRTRSAYALALKLRPGDAALRFNHALFALSQGNLDAGWRDYEARLQAGYPGLVRRDLKMKRWRGAAKADGRLLVLAEQGVGDELHFLHCLPDVAAEWGEVWWECDPRLLELLSGSFPNVRFVAWQGSEKPGVHRGYDWLADGPKFDNCIEAGSLQTIYRKRLDQFPSQPGLLQAASAPPLRDFRVGITWTSTHRNRLRDRGYVPLSEWGPIFGVPGVRWVNLQYGDSANDIAEAEARFGITIEQTPGLDLKDDFSGTARLMSGLDLVVGPTNAARQLAASAGVRTLVLSRLPYEFGLGQSVNPFFPNMTDYVRLPDLYWSRQVQAIATEIGKAAASKAQRAA